MLEFEDKFKEIKMREFKVKVIEKYVCLD